MSKPRSSLRPGRALLPVLSLLFFFLANLSQTANGQEPWYQIRREPEVCFVPKQGPAEVLEHVCGGLIQCKTDDMTDPASHRVTQTTVWVYSMGPDQPPVGFTFYRGRQRCESTLATLKAKKRALLSRYGPQVQIKPLPPSKDSKSASFEAAGQNGALKQFDSLDGSNIRPSTLAAAQRGAIGDDVRDCWIPPGHDADVSEMSVLLRIETDRQGVARAVDVSPNDRSRLEDPAFRAFAESARRAVLNPRCAALPLPKSMLGRSVMLELRFTP